MNRSKYQVPEVDKNDGLESDIRTFMGTKISDNLKDGNKQQVDDFLDAITG